MYSAGLTGYGLSVIETTSAEGALKLVNDGLRPDVVIIDPGISNGSGYAVIEAVKNHMGDANVRIIVSTGNRNEDILGADFILSKPASVMEIVSLL